MSKNEKFIELPFKEEEGGFFDEFGLDSNVLFSKDLVGKGGNPVSEIFKSVCLL